VTSIDWCGGTWENESNNYNEVLSKRKIIFKMWKRKKTQLIAFKNSLKAINVSDNVKNFISGYRSIGPGSIPCATRFSEK
jgi:hypothetical protein